MNQGVTAHRDRFRALSDPRPGQAAVQELERESELLRDALQSDLSGLISTINLGEDGFLARGYEAGNVIAEEYDVRDLPEERTLRADLERFLAIYKEVIEVRDRVLVEQPGRLHLPTRTSAAAARSDVRRPPVFRPKDASDYVANISQHQQRRTRKHEELVLRFGKHARERGWTGATNVHPRDLVLSKASQEVLVEAKTVPNNAELAVREAIGQLFAYRHFIYRARGQSDPILLALFAEPVGDAFATLLTDLGITTGWFSDRTWRGTARLDGLLESS
jgi:hypothetical protein